MLFFNFFRSLTVFIICQSKRDENIPNLNRNASLKIIMVVLEVSKESGRYIFFIFKNKKKDNFITKKL